MYRWLEVSSTLDLRARLDGAPQAAGQACLAVVISEPGPSLEEGIARRQAVAKAPRIISRSCGDVDAVTPAIPGFAPEPCGAAFGILLDHDFQARWRTSCAQGIRAAFRGWLDESGAPEARRRGALG